MNIPIRNPYQPGAGHSPPHLAGRQAERAEFRRLLEQTTILENAILTGIRGIGKTSLLRDFFKTDALAAGWLWVENDMSESASNNEARLITRILADLGVKIGGMTVARNERTAIGFVAATDTTEVKADYQFLSAVAETTPGLASDKLKAVLSLTWEILRRQNNKPSGVVFAYDEAQNMSDHDKLGEFPLSMLLDVFSSLQRQGMPYMLVLTGLPPLFPKLVESRTFAERMFRVIQLNNLNREEAKEAVLTPVQNDNQVISDYFARASSGIHNITRGYPYFIQYWCRELYEYIHLADAREEDLIERIRRKLDADFFDGRWQQLTDRERDLLRIVAGFLSDSQDEFAVQQISKLPSEPDIKKISPSHATQMLNNLSQKGMVFKNRHGRYALAVPLLADYIRRRYRRKTTTPE